MACCVSKVAKKTAPPVNYLLASTVEVLVTKLSLRHARNTEAFGRLNLSVDGLSFAQQSR